MCIFSQKRPDINPSLAEKKADMKIFIRLIFPVLILIFQFCDIVTSPSPEPLPVFTSDTVTQPNSARIFLVNGNRQICNPSISIDTVNFKGCMLWLNFSGELAVNVPSDMSGFDLYARQHDRLTISDTSNTVRWFMSREQFGAQISEELQDPEWTTHPHFINCLLSSQVRKNWSCIAIHTLSKKFLRMSNENLNETSTPHIWINENSVFNGDTSAIRFDSSGFICKESVQSFFGTQDVKLVFSRKEGVSLSLYYVDFNNSSSPVQLQRPADKAAYDLESTLISPDGKWIAFNAYHSNTDYHCYIQELRAGSKPILFQSNAMDPHWWYHPANKSEVYLIYTEIPGGYIVSQDLSDPDFLSGSAGVTYRQAVSLYPGYSGITSFSRKGNPEVIVRLPLKGGWSPDGAYLCTGYDRAYLVGL